WTTMGRMARIGADQATALTRLPYPRASAPSSSTPRKPADV
ncbi:MAG: hypothetical protein AVDCRST_MAG11-1889, partial [uncultured Gemmatimonadaceae bacterium]